MMLTKEEEAFVRYWADQRMRKKQFLKKFSIGLPLAVLLAAAVMVNMLSGWYEKANMELKKHSSVIVVVLVAIIAIVVFIVIFASRHQWDQNELHYQELMNKKNKTD